MKALENILIAAPAGRPFISLHKNTQWGLLVWIPAPVGVRMLGCDVLYALHVTGQALLKAKPHNTFPPLAVSRRRGAVIRANGRLVQHDFKGLVLFSSRQVVTKLFPFKKYEG